MHQIVREDIDSILATEDNLSFLNDKTLIISGANSFLMSYLIYSILESNRRFGNNTRVIALCRDRQRAEKRFTEYLSDPLFHLEIQDIRQTTLCVQNVDYCIHAASPAGIASRQEKPIDTFETNLIGCRNLLQVCAEQDVKKFLLVSSVDVYGQQNMQRRLRETDFGVLDWTYSRNAYSCGKRAAETLCFLYYAQYGFPCVVARPFQVYGPGMSLDDGRLHGDFVGQIIAEHKIKLYSSGTARRSFLYLSDATCALFELLSKGANGEAYNVCDEDGERSVVELAKLYAAAIDGTIYVEMCHGKEDTPEVKEAPSAVLGDAAKLRALGWNSSVALEDGIRRTLQYYGLRE